MVLNPFKLLFPRKFLGVDIGISSIKVVEISRWGGGITLENYGEIKSASLFKEEFRTFKKDTRSISSYFVSRALRAILDEARIKTKAAFFSLPDFSAFLTSFELPPMEEKEIPQAVRFTAPRYTPLSISETTLDWRLIEGIPGNKESKLKVLLIAIPNNVIEDYKRTAQMAGLELYALEAEILGIMRSLIKKNKKVICLLDIGVQSTTISIVDRGILKKSYSFDFSGNQLTYAIAQTLDIEYTQAEEIKCKQGLTSQDENIVKTLRFLIDPLFLEIRKISGEFEQTEGKNFEEIYLTGGTANLPGLKEYFSAVLKKKIEVPNSFEGFLFPPILNEILKEMNPRFSAAVGAALGGLER